MGQTQQSLLEAIARAVGVTVGVSVGNPVTIGLLWLAFKASRPRGRAWQHERNLLRPFVLRFWRRAAASLTPSSWDEHRRQRRREKTRLGRPPCQLTLNWELLRAKYFLRWAVRERRLGENPLADCRPVKTRARRGSWFNEEQIGRLLAASWSLRWDHQQRTFRALVAAMAETGLRISEALSLRWDRISARGTTTVTGKGGKARVIGLTPLVLRTVASLGQHETNPHVFTNARTGTVYDASTVRRWFKTAIEAAGLERVKADGDLALVPHILRHSFASIAEAKGARREWIQAALGHDRMETTMVYLHREEEDAALRMAAIMGERRPPQRAEEKFTAHEKEVVKLERRA